MKAFHLYWEKPFASRPQRAAAAKVSSSCFWLLVLLALPYGQEGRCRGTELPTGLDFALPGRLDPAWGLARPAAGTAELSLEARSCTGRRTLSLTKTACFYSSVCVGGSREPQEGERNASSSVVLFRSPSFNANASTRCQSLVGSIR